MKLETVFAFILIVGFSAFAVKVLIAPKLEPEVIEVAISEPASPHREAIFEVPVANAAILRKDRDGHFWADADVDGTHVRFMVDTGASTVALTYRDAQRIGLEPDTLDYAWRIRTAGGEVMGASVLLEDIEIGQVRIRDVEAMILRDGLTQSLLGMSFLNELESYEFRQSNLIIRQ